MTIQINEANALQAYKNADSKGKALLSDLIGKEVFNRSITDRVKTFADACELLSYSEKLPELSPALQAHYKLVMIAEALNEGWTPDWNDSNQYKYFPYFDMTGGFSFYHGVLSGCTCSYLGSRLCFKTEALAKYAGTQFLDLYRAYFVIE